MDERPGFVTVLFAVYISGALVSAIGGQLTSRLFRSWVDPSTSHSGAVNRYAVTVVGGALVASIAAGVVVFVILGLDGYGPSLLRSLLGMAVGGVVTAIIQLSFTLDLIDKTGTGVSVTPAVDALRSLAYLPLSFAGLFISTLIISSGVGRQTATGPGGSPWEYKLPPGTKWRD